MAWVDLSSAFAFGSTLGSTEMQNLRDNITAIANGDSGAPNIQTAALDTNAVTGTELASGSVDQSALSTTTVSANGTITNGNQVYITLNAYSFWPMFWNALNVNDVFMSGHNTDAVDPDSPRFAIRNDSGFSVNYAVDHRYIDAT